MARVKDTFMLLLEQHKTKRAILIGKNVGEEVNNKLTEGIKRPAAENFQLESFVDDNPQSHNTGENPEKLPTKDKRHDPTKDMRAQK